jgi:hypothetical protein
MQAMGAFMNQARGCVGCAATVLVLACCSDRAPSGVATTSPAPPSVSTLVSSPPSSGAPRASDAGAPKPVIDYSVEYTTEMRGVALVPGDALFVSQEGLVELIPGSAEPGAGIPRAEKVEPAALAELASVLGEAATQALESVPPLGEGRISFVHIRSRDWSKQLELALPAPAQARPLLDALGKLRAHAQANGKPVEALAGYTLVLKREDHGARLVRHATLTVKYDGTLELAPPNGKPTQARLKPADMAPLASLLGSPSLQALKCAPAQGESQRWSLEVTAPRASWKVGCSVPMPLVAGLLDHELWQLRYAAKLPED